MTRPTSSVALLVVLSCGPAAPAATSFGVGPGTTSETAATTTGVGSTSSSSSPSPDSTSSSTGDSSTGPELASSTGTESPPDFPPVGPEGCEGKIDFLFVISNSGTMTSHQDQVHAALPDFINSIKSQFADFDSHIMVVDTDDFWHMPKCSLCGPGCNPNGTPPLCGAELDECDSTLGAGVTFPSGKDSSARLCDLASGRYITREDPDLTAAFLCVARVGSDGAASRPADAMVAAISPPLLGTKGYPLGCNQGFLRDDALLVVTLISDGYDQESSGPAEAWRKVLMEAKHQDGDAFQLLVITTDVDVVGGLCGDYSGATNRLHTFVDIVPHGKIGSICAESYGPFFDEAVSDVLERCDSFTPPQ